MATAAGAGAGGMLTLSRRVFDPAELSTFSAFVIRPTLPRRSMVATMTPFVPGDNLHGCSGNFAAVQSHEVLNL